MENSALVLLKETRKEEVAERREFKAARDTATQKVARESESGKRDFQFDMMDV